MNDVKISFIVPIYNSENTLSRCIESVLNQSYNNFELLLINDGSSDESLKICKMYAKKDKRIKVFSHDNKGISYTRNVGLSKATGTHIMFLDSDDCFKLNSLQHIVDIVKDKNFDLLSFNYDKFIDNPKMNISMKKKSKLVKKDDMIFNILIEKKYSGVCWNKVIKKEIINNVKFDEKIGIGEDLDFILSILESDLKIFHDNTILYNFYVNPKSITHDNVLNQIHKWDSEVELCYNIINNYKNSKKLYEAAIRRYCRINMFLYKSLNDNKLKMKYKDNCLKYKKIVLKSKYINYIFKLKYIYNIIFK